MSVDWACSVLHVCVRAYSQQEMMSLVMVWHDQVLTMCLNIGRFYNTKSELSHHHVTFFVGLQTSYTT